MEKSILKLMFSCVVLLFFASCTSTVREEQGKFSCGQVFTGSITVLDNVIPLDEGEWVLAAHSVNQRSFLQMNLLKIENGTIHTHMYISVRDKKVKSGGYLASEYCDRENFHFKDVKSNIRNSDQDCFVVNHIVNFGFTKDTALDRDTFKYIKENSISVPKTVIQTYHRFANHQGYYLNVLYQYNPESSGFEPDNTSSWNGSAWNFSRVHEDKQKVQYIAEIKEKGLEQHTQLRQGLSFN
ncbi:hypothetical protein KJ966_02755 [bacterium]|nr:hypothetical protein [bacterium]